MALFMTSCRETFDDLFSDEIKEGEEVMFTTSLPSASMTRATEEETAYRNKMKAYKAVTEGYEFNIGMYDSNGLIDTTSIYKPKKVTDEIEGTLAIKAGETPLYWPNTTTAYGFSVTAGDVELQKDQSSTDKWLKQDLLKGFGYVEAWDADKNEAVDDLTKLNYHTAKEWKKLNVYSKLLSNEKDYKKIPLYLQHQRALITVVLKAGEGVSRKALEYEAANKDIITHIYSYNKGTLEITPLPSETTVIYDGETDEVSTTRYDAIVEPYNYSANPSTDLIAKVTLSGQNYSFYKDNDTTSPEENYNLTAGKHLTLTVTLGRGSRKTIMSAYIENWTEQVTSTICDDYGNASDPIKIKNRDELIDFLKDDTKNKAGNVALVTAEIDLEATSTKYKEAWSSYNNSDLNCTLDLGNFALMSNSRFLKDMGTAASLLNGTIQIAGNVDAAIAQKNAGTISNVKITAKAGTEPYASEAGAVIDNTGTISKCSSSLKVVGSSAENVGGIAATSLSSSDKTAIIDGCTVTNHVGGSSTANVGGIVGCANGCVTNNTFEYGITLSQPSKHMNIVGEKNSDHNLTNTGNAWPTIASNLDMQNAYANPYTGIIESGDELKKATGDGRYRLAKDISVTETIDNVAFELDGNGKQIATTTMIFKSVTSHLHDFTIMVNNNLSVGATNDGTDVMAPLALEVHGAEAKISNVKVKMASDAISVTASNPAGLVVWLYGGATISNCEAKVNIISQAPTTLSQGHKFAGGIVAAVSNGTVTQCVLHTGSTLSGSDSEVAYYGGIVGGVMLKEGSGDKLELTINDCTSYIKLANDAHHGSILGYALNGTGSENATADGCQGNWWPTDTDCRGVGSYDGSVESAIGKRNAITPSENTNF